MSALPPITDVGLRIQVGIWLSIYEYTALSAVTATHGDWSSQTGVEALLRPLMGPKSRACGGHVEQIGASDGYSGS